MHIRGCTFLKWFGINGIVIYPFVMYCDVNPSEAVTNHEGIHLQQISRDGILRFYSRYVAEYLVGRWRGFNHDQAYRRISYEQEAYGHQNNQKYVVSNG